MSKATTIHISSKEDWNYLEDRGWVGGKYTVPNLSGGYHGILTQWLDYHIVDKESCLLVSENKLVKDKFKSTYPIITFKTLEYYEEMNQDIDLKYNLCDQWDSDGMEKFDIILCQATFEHLYDPCMALRNLRDILMPGGVVLIHTHVPGMEYHPYPKDYLRFYPDWFIDAAEFSKGLELIDLVEVGVHIFSAYKKIGDQNV